MRLSASAVLALLVVGFLAGYTAALSQQPAPATQTVVKPTTVATATTVVRTTTITQQLTTTTTKTATLHHAVSVGGKPVDIVARVIRAVDGDTFDSHPAGRVRLADVNTPERGQPGYTEATNALRALIEGKTVYLDVDDLLVMDPYNRLVAVVYVDHNSTHVLNVNLWLVVNNHAVLYDLRNEFNPSAWILYVRKA
ncbi:MAG: thermonuclease family protein [Candidatus Caldarchaeum sp.]